MKLVTIDKFKELEEKALKENNILFLMYRQNASTNKFYYYYNTEYKSDYLDFISKVLCFSELALDFLVDSMSKLGNESDLKKDKIEINNNFILGYIIDFVSSKLIKSGISLEDYELYNWENLSFKREYSSFSEYLMLVFDKSKNSVFMYYTEPIVNQYSYFLLYLALALDDVYILPENIDLLEFLRQLTVKFILDLFFLRKDPIYYELVEITKKRLSHLENVEISDDNL